MVAPVPPLYHEAYLVGTPEFFEKAHEAAQSIFRQHQMPGQNIPANVVLAAADELYPQSSPYESESPYTFSLWLVAVGIEIGEYRAHDCGSWDAP